MLGDRSHRTVHSTRFPSQKLPQPLGQTLPPEPTGKGPGHCGTVTVTRTATTG